MLLQLNNKDVDFVTEGLSQVFKKKSTKDGINFHTNPGLNDPRNKLN